jgi:3-oxoacyl-[acyl-carrier protein] reductase
MEFAGNTVIVTGGARGIGQAAARAFLARGARVAICARHAHTLAAAERRLAAHGELLAVRCDVRDRAQVEQFVAQTSARFGAVDVLVNNAGVAWSGDFAAEDDASIDEVLDVNLKGVLVVTRAVLPAMLARGRGVIVNVASGAGLAGFAGLAAYCASKFGVVGFTASLAREVADQGVRVYAVCPGRVATDMQVQYSGQRIGMPPERVAECIVGLAGPRPRARVGGCVELP